MMTLIPAAERTDFELFPTRLKEEVVRLLPHLDAVRNAESVTAALSVQAQAAGVPLGTFRRKFYAWRDHGWRGLIPANSVPKFLINSCARLNQEFISEWRRRVENVQRRAMRQAHHQLLRDIRSGKPVGGLPHWAKLYAEDFPGRAIPECCPISWIPRGLTYSNLKRYAPSAFELRTARQGRRAASALRPLVLTTRVGLKVGQRYVFDDMWHDHKVNFFDCAQTAALRPLEFHCIDLASTRKVAWGIRPRRVREDGTHEQLQDREMRQLLCQVLCTIGYRPEGTTLDVENGTAAINKNLEEIIDYITDGAVQVQRGGIDKRTLLKGAFAPRGVGNFRHKAALESLGNLYHNALADLPGQTGLSPAAQPEDSYGRDQYNTALLKAVKSMAPERSAKLFFPVLEFNEFANLLMEVYERIDARTEHNLEGWGEAGYIEQVFVPGPGIDPIPMSIILANQEQFHGALTLAHSDPTRFVAFRRLSPAAVWQRGCKELVTIPVIHAPAILGRNNACLAKVSRKYELWLTDQDTGRRTRYSPELRQFNSPFSNILPAGEEYLVYPIPGDNQAVICDVKGAPIGWVIQMAVASKADRQQLLAAHGQAEHIRAALESGYRARHAPDVAQIQDMRAYNAAILAGNDQDETDETDVREKTEIDDTAYLSKPAIAESDDLF